jgi:hypothetical protein
MAEFSLGTAALGTEVDLSGLQRGMKDAEGQAEASGSRIGSILSGALKAGLVGAGVAVAAGLGTAITAGLQFNNSMEIVTAQLNAFTKDGAKTAEILEMIKARAAATPFAFEEMAKAASSLLPASKASGKGLEELIGLAEILAASNPAEGLEGASFALKEALSGDFTSIIERFNLPRQRLKELREQGVPDLEAVKTAMAELGLDTSLVTNLANTASGRWSTFLDTLTNVAATATAPIFDAFSSSLAGVNDWLTANTPMLEAFGATLASGVGGAIQTVAGVIGGAIGTFQVFTGFFEDAQTEVSGFGNQVGYALDSLIGVADGVVGPFQSAGLVIDQLGGIVQSAMAAATAGVQQAAPAFDTMLGAWSTATSAVQGVLSQLGGIVSSVLANVQGFIDTYGAQAVATFATTWATVQTTVATLVTALMGVISPILAQIQTFINSHGAEIQAFFAQTWQQIGTIVQTAMALINATIVPALQMIGGFIASHGTEIQALLGNTWTAVSTIISTVLATIQGIITAALQIIKGDWSGAWETIRQTCATIVQGIITVIQSGLGNLNVLFGDALRSVISTVTGFHGQMVSVGSNLVRGMIDGVKNAAGQLASAAADAAKNALDAAKRALGISSPSREAAEQVGTPFVMGIVQGMENSFGLVTSMARKLSKQLTKEMEAVATEATKAFQKMFRDGLKADVDFARLAAANLDAVDQLFGESTYDDLMAKRGDLETEQQEARAAHDQRLKELETERDAKIAEIAATSDFQADKDKKIAELRAEYQQKLDKEAGGFAKQERDAREKLADLDAALDREDAAADDREGIAEAARQQLEIARKQAEAMKQADPARAQDFYELRTKQILELAKLDAQAATARLDGDDAEVARLEEKRRLLEQAQAAEQRLFDETASDKSPLAATAEKLEAMRKALQDEVKLDQERADKTTDPRKRAERQAEADQSREALRQIEALIAQMQAGAGPLAQTGVGLTAAMAPLTETSAKLTTLPDNIADAIVSKGGIQISVNDGGQSWLQQLIRVEAQKLLTGAGVAADIALRS